MSGRAYGCNTGFTLPNGAVRSPGVAWILKPRVRALPKHDRERFGHICPDFVIELKSPLQTRCRLSRGRCRPGRSAGRRIIGFRRPGASRLQPRSHGSVLTRLGLAAASKLLQPTLVHHLLELELVFDLHATIASHKLDLFVIERNWSGTREREQDG